MSWSTEADHEALMIANLLSQFQESPRFQAFIKALAAGVQQLEDEIDDLITLRAFDVATDAALDQWATIVGEQRTGLTDTEFRRFIAAKILINNSGGTPEELIAILSTMTGASAAHQNLYPANYQMSVSSGTGYSAAVLRRIGRAMELARPAGIGSQTLLGTEDGFRFDSATLGFDQGELAAVV